MSRSETKGSARVACLLDEAKKKRLTVVILQLLILLRELLGSIDPLSIRVDHVVALKKDVERRRVERDLLGWKKLVVLVDFAGDPVSFELLNDERTGEGGKNESAREGRGELEGTSRFESKEEGRRERE